MRAGARFTWCLSYLVAAVLLPMELVIRGFLDVDLVPSVSVGPWFQVRVSPICALLDLRARLGPAWLRLRHQGERIIGFGFGRDLPAADMETAAPLAAVDDQPMPLAALAGCLLP
jgi:hypothetical protein